MCCLLWKYLIKFSEFLRNVFVAQNIITSSTNQRRCRTVSFSTKFSSNNVENAIKTKHDNANQKFSYFPSRFFHCCTMLRWTRWKNIFLSHNKNIRWVVEVSESAKNDEENIFCAAPLHHQFQFNLVNKRMFQRITHIIRMIVSVEISQICSFCCWSFACEEFYPLIGMHLACDEDKVLKMCKLIT